MKMNAEPTYVHTDGVGEVRRATINSSAKIFNFFSKQVYSDFYTAAWRELVANAIDGQRVNGNTAPPIVTVPSILEPMAKVRDFGCSMDHEFMLNDFMCFGEASTKDNSDEMIGGFGIGSKAPLAYTDQYSIRCFKDGKVRVYSVFKDAEDCPSIAFLSEAETTEPDGVEVAFPVRQDDIEKFTSTVVPTLQYFDPLPVLENTDLKLEPVKYDAKGNRWGVRMMSVDRKPKIIIGGVSYPLDVAKVPWSYTTLREFAGLGIDLYLDIGEANIALSREHVTHDEALFKKLNAIVEGIGEEFGKQMSKMFDVCKTPWEAKTKLVVSLKDTHGNMGNILRKNAFWKGQKIDPHIKKPDKVELLCITYGDFGWQDTMSGLISTKAVSPKFRIWADHAYFVPTTFNRIVIADTDDKPMLRLRALIEANPNERIFVIKDNSPKHDTDMKKVLEAMGSPPASMIDYLSKWAPLKIVRAVGVGASARPFRCFVGRKPWGRNDQSGQDTLPTTPGVYVVMDNYSCQASSKSLEVAAMLGKTMVYLNLTDFKASGVDKLPGWLSVDQAVEEVKKAYRAKHKNLAMAEAYYRWSNRDEWDYYIEKLSKLSGFPKRGPLAEILRLRETYKDVSDSGHSEIRCNLLGVKWEGKHQKLVDLSAKARSKHPHIAEIVKDSYLIRKMSDSLINKLF